MTNLRPTPPVGPLRKSRPTSNKGPRPSPALGAEHLASLLHRHQGNRRLVAKELGVSERTIYRKLRSFGLE